APPAVAFGLGDSLAEADDARAVRLGHRRLPAPWPARGLERADVLRLRALLALGGVELDALVVFEALVAVAADRREVDEDVLAAVVRSDEAEALLAVEPLHCALCHCAVLL